MAALRRQQDLPAACASSRDYARFPRRFRKETALFSVSATTTTTLEASFRHFEKGTRNDIPLSRAASSRGGGGSGGKGRRAGHNARISHIADTFNAPACRASRAHCKGARHRQGEGDGGL